MSSFHGLSAEELAQMPWRRFYNFYKGLSNTEHSSYRAWRDWYVQNKPDEQIIEAEKVTPEEVLKGFAINPALLHQEKAIETLPTGGFDY